MCLCLQIWLGRRTPIQTSLRIIGASLSEPHLVSTTAALSVYIYNYIYIHRTSSTRDQLLSTCTFNPGLVPSSPDLLLRVDVMSTQCVHVAEARSLLEASGICDSKRGRHGLSGSFSSSDAMISSKEAPSSSDRNPTRAEAEMLVSQAPAEHKQC